MNLESIPISTRWLLDAVGDTGRSAINAVYRIACPNTQSKGTGFLLKSGGLVTNWHVICHCAARINTATPCSCDPAAIVQDVIAIGSKGQQERFRRLSFDQHADLALLELHLTLQGGVDIRTDFDIPIGTQVCTWGYPLGYDGPAPILTTGYLAGFVDPGKPPVKHYVVNAAFNPGNSGGPLFVAGEDKVIGVVVSKHAPISPWLASIIEALKNQKGGFVYTATNAQGGRETFSEAQLVAEVLLYFRQMTQVVLGEAIYGEDLTLFITARGNPAK